MKSTKVLTLDALLILVCNTKHICFCHESALNLIATSWQLEELTSAMDEDCDWLHISSVSFEPVLVSWVLVNINLQESCIKCPTGPYSQSMHS